MSLQTWKEEYYPIPADEVKEEDAIQHSLTKWTGLLPENKRRHGVFRTLKEGTPVIQDVDGRSLLSISGETCSLCKIHFYALPNEVSCFSCPIASVNHRLNCNSEYFAYRKHNDPVPMIELLKNTLLHSQKGNNGE